MDRKLTPASILILGPALDTISGVTTHITQLLNSALADKFKLSHFQVGSEGRNETGRGKIVRLIWSFFLLPRQIVQKKIDIVHINTSMDFKGYWRDAIYLLLAKVFRRKIVYQIHGGVNGPHFFDHDVLAFFKKWLLTMPDVVVLLSSNEKKVADGFCRFKRLLVISNAIELEQYSGIGPKAFMTQPLKLGFIGRLVESKGLFESIEAIALLKGQGINNLNFLIAGSGADEVKLRDKVSQLQLNDEVEFLGSIFAEKKLSFWRDIDILIFPSHFEGLPYVALESLASGTPLVTTKVGGLPDAVEDGKQGILVPVRDAKAIAEAIQSLVTDRDKLTEMSNACCKKARQQYGIDRLAEDFNRLYRAIAG